MNVYEAIARNLREFGYRDVTAEMIRETDEARKAGHPSSEPHGIISMFATRQLEDADEVINSPVDAVDNVSEGEAQ